jgi:hypothetical protein
MKEAGVKKFARLVAPVALGLAVCAGLLATGPQASAGVPAAGRSGAQGTAAQSKLYGKLQETVKNSSADTRLRVIVHMRDQLDMSTWPLNDRAGAIIALRNKATSGQAAIRTSLAQESMDANVYMNYWIFNGFAVEAPASTIRALATRDDVDYIIEDGYMRLPKFEIQTDNGESPASNWNIYQVRAPETWALGYDGTGRVLANIDSGVQGDHPALVDRWRGVNGGTPANSWYDPYNLSPAFPSDPNGHGTHTMGTIAGYQGNNTGPNEVGQSKGATWIAARNYDASGKGPFSYMHAAFQFMADPDGDPNTNDQPDAVGNSWGESDAFAYPDLEWWGEIEVWRAVGIMPIFSNGNDGPQPRTVGKPGGYPIVTGVGAIDINSNIAGFSSRGPAPDQDPWNNRDYWERSTWNLLKPDVVAPGVNIRSALPGSSYGNISGTSMASPHVTGMVGMLRQIRPDLTYNEFYNIILDTAVFSPTMGTRPNNNYGWGKIDDYAAAIYVRDAGAIMGPIMDGSCNAAVAGADVRVYTDIRGETNAGIRKMRSDNNGNYRTILAAGTYTVTVSAPGFYGQVFNTTVMSSTTNTLPITLVKMATGEVTGSVTDGSGPVAGAVVSVVGLSNLRATTGSGGSYTLSNVPDGTFTIRAEKCGYVSDSANVTIMYPNNATQNFALNAATTLIFDDFEDGDLAGWTVTGGSATTGIWHNSALRGNNSNRSARAGRTDGPTYNSTINTQMTADGVYDTAASEKVWLSFDYYASTETEYDVFKIQISTDGGATWPNTGAVYGESGPHPEWRSFCLDVTQWRSATMKVRLSFNTDATNWNGEVFEGPFIDNIHLSHNPNASNTAVPALTPTPGTPIPCTPIPTATMTVEATNTVEATVEPTNTPGGPSPTTVPPCTIEFDDVPTSNTFYANIRCLACRGIMGGYTDGTFRPNNNITRGQLSKIVANSAGFNEPVTGQTFEDVLPSNTFYDVIERMASRGIIGGYPCSGPFEPCGTPNRPYFRPNANATRGQISKIVSEAAGYNDPPQRQTFQDVPTGSTFHEWIERLVSRNIMGGYPCGGANEPCIPPDDRPYFRPNNNATRGQTSKIVANTFYPNCVTP